jgi:hypothetical protein
LGVTTAARAAKGRKMNRIKSDVDIAKSAANYDTGYCNPMKNKFANEARRDAIFELEDRGYSRSEAERLIRDQE